MLSGSGGKVDFDSLAILATAAIMIPDQPEFYRSKVVQPCHAACEIREPWVKWFKRISHLNGLKCQG